MQTARIRFILALCLFTAWIGWLGYLAFTTRGQIVLSRPQFLVANVKVVASLAGDGDYADGSAIVKEVLATSDKAIGVAKGKKIVVQDLELCGKASGWKGPGDYILALTWRVSEKTPAPETLSAVALVGSPVANAALAAVNALPSPEQVVLTVVPVSPGFPLSTDRSEEGYVQVVQRQIALQERITRILEEVNDRETLTAARVKLRRLYPDARKLERESLLLRTPSAEIRAELKAKYEANLQSVFQKLAKETLRVAQLRLPGGDDVIATLRSFDSPDVERLRIYPANNQTLKQLQQIERSWQ